MKMPTSSSESYTFAEDPFWLAHSEGQLPECVIHEIHLGPNNVHEGLGIDQDLHTFVLNQLVEFPLLVWRRVSIQG